MGFRKRAEELAIAAAPYCHPRQGNVGDEAPVSDFMPLAERIAVAVRMTV